MTERSGHQFRQSLEKVLTPLESVRALVAAYFKREEDRFAGTAFQKYEPGDPNTISSADLLAVGFLDEPFTARAVVALSSNLEKVAQHLGKMPDTAIWEPEADLRTGGTAQALYDLLIELPDVGMTRATKLMARKRPSLVPIVDGVVKRLIKSPDRKACTYWIGYQEAMRDMDFRRRVEHLRPDDFAEAETPVLRILDVAIWMRGNRSKPARRTRARHGVPDWPEIGPK